MKSKDPKLDKIMEDIVGDPDEISQSILLWGFLVKSSREGYFRLYLNPKIDRYYEMAACDIINTVPLLIQKTILLEAPLFGSRKRPQSSIPSSLKQSRLRLTS